MCMMVYIASSTPLPLIPWDEEKPAFHVATVRPTHGVRLQFSYANFYYVGSHESCGCGFQIGEYPEFERDEQEQREMRSSLDAFADYVERHLVEAGKIEVFASWDGDQCQPVELRRELTAADLRDDDFFFYEKELSIFVA